MLTHSVQECALKLNGVAASAMAQSKNAKTTV